MLDTLTLIIVLIVSNLLMAGAMWISFAGRFEAGLGPWTGSLIVQGFSWLLVAMRNDMPDFISVAVATAFLVYCWALQVSALLEFHGKKTPRWLLYGPPVIAFLTVVIYVREPRARLALCGVGFGLAQFVTGAGLLYYRVSAEKRTRLLLAGSFFVMAAGLFWLAFTAWFEPEAILPTFGPRPAPGGSLLAFYGVTIGSSFAFLLMHKERGDREKHELATTDPLTGVYNRRTFKDLAEPLLSRARRSRGEVSLLLLDLDHFKHVNDTHGHLAGDQVLAGFARLTRACLRKEDLLARYGGEEFVVMLPGTSEEAAVALAERIREEVAASALIPTTESLRVTVSIGVAGDKGEHVATLEGLLGRADEALYAAKARGRNCVVASTPSMRLAAAAAG
jgi:diguanylate cyclase (GGDEF)-like protein